MIVRLCPFMYQSSKQTYDNPKQKNCENKSRDEELQNTA